MSFFIVLRVQNCGNSITSVLGLTKGQAGQTAALGSKTLLYFSEMWW